jgi:ParB/RepB/Spo0J family partition protein
MPRSTTQKTMKNNIQKILAGEQSSLLVKNIAPSGTNRDITEEQLAEMIESVRIHGVIQPLIVRPVECVTDERVRKAAGKASHVLVAGERRWRSARTVGLEKVQVVIRQLTDREALELQAIENLQRKDLNDIEEARQYRRLLDCGSKAEEVASRISKSRAHIYNCLKLLELPKEAQDALSSGKLDRAIALLIARIAHPDARKEATRQILAGRTVYNHQTQKQEPVRLTFREAKQFIIQNFMLQLSNAPFDLQQADLVEGVPSCVTCPKRAGNIKDLFPDLSAKNRNDVCTDPKCFAAKKEAVWQRVKVEAEASGAVVLDEKTTKKVMPYDNGHVEAGSGYIALSECCVHDPKRRTWEQVLGRKAPTLSFARSADGQVHRLVEKEAALEVVRGMGLKIEERPIGRTMQDADREAREASLIRRTVQERAVVQVLEKLAKHKNCTEKSLQLALSWLVQDAGFETKKAILRARGLDPKEAHTAFTEFFAKVKPAEYPALALELALWSAFYNCFHGSSKLLTESSAVLRVELDAIEKAVKEERKQFWKEKKAKAKERAAK